MNTEELRQKVIEILEKNGIARGNEGKGSLRQLHDPARQMELCARQDWLRWALPRYSTFFANGEEVNPEKIRPILVEVTTEREHELFRFARLVWWSIPFSKGYGRRLRFLVMDESNGKLIGLLALQSPPLSFPARDRLFQYPPGHKTELPESVNQPA